MAIQQQPPYAVGGQGGQQQGQQPMQQQQPQQFQQPQQTQTQAPQQTGLTLEDGLQGDMRLTLHDFVQAATACEWCAEQCIDEPGMEECVRLCRDVADLAIQNVKFVSRDSIFGPQVAETFAYAAQECANECARHPHAHCQDCARTLQRAVDSTWEMLTALGYQPQGQI